MNKLVNLTPHPVVLRDAQGNDTVVPLTEPEARVSSAQGQSEAVLGIPVPVFGPDEFGEVVGLPEPQEGIIFIVSLLVASRPKVAGRPDVVRPGTGPKDGAVRDEQGRIVAVTRLIRA